MQIINFQLLSIETAKRYSAIWNMIDMRFPDLPNKERAWIVGLVVGTWPGCYEQAEKDCYCLYDE